MPTSAEFFDKLLPAALAKSPPPPGAVYHFTVTASPTTWKNWTLDLAARPPKVLSGLAGKAGMSATMSEADFQALLANPASAMQLYFSGKLKVTGDVMLASKLQAVLGLAK